MSSNVTSDEVFQYTGRENVPKDVTIVHFHCSVVNLEDETFRECTKLKEVVLNNGLKTIGAGAFYGCKSLEHITLPSTVVNIGDQTFGECTKLKEVALNNGLKKIGMRAFGGVILSSYSKGCKSLERITIPSTVTDIGVGAFQKCTQLKEVMLNEGLKIIGDNVFDNCKSLQSITIPSTVTEIGERAFRDCKWLREVFLNEGLQKIGKYTFGGCSSLQSITLPSTVTGIDGHAFVVCSSLTEVVLNNGLEKIGYCTFDRCSSLTSITIPSTVTGIDSLAFSRCSSLHEVVLNEGLVKIAEHAFFGCHSLQSITIPSSVVEIGSWAFQGCSGLSEVVFSGGLPKIGSSTFNDCLALESIIFPNLSTRLEDIIQAGQMDAQNKVQFNINQSDIEWEREGTIYIPMEEVTRGRDEWEWDIVKEHFRQIVKWIKYYEMKEATTIFELALWKAKIDQVEEDAYERGRDLCRVDVPGPVKDTILQYLDL